MYSTRSSTSKRTGRKANGRPDGRESAVQHKKQNRPADVLTESDSATSDTGLDLIDLIDHQLDSETTVHQNEEKRSPQKGLGMPSFNLCACCQKLYHKAKRMKRPLKDKLIDNDPRSLTCDQWVLRKPWKPRRQSKLESKCESHLKLIKRIFKAQNQLNPCEVMRGQSACSRPHTFLQRNLRICTAVKRGKRRSKKRARSISEAPRLSKQPNLHRNSWHGNTILQNPSLNKSSSFFDSAVGSCSEEYTEHSPTHIVLEVIPSSVTMEPMPKQESVANQDQEVPARRNGFRDLLTQLRGNRSVIVREHYL